jgi:hypothetical protein
MPMVPMPMVPLPMVRMPMVRMPMILVNARRTLPPRRRTCGAGRIWRWASSGMIRLVTRSALPSTGLVFTATSAVPGRPLDATHPRCTRPTDARPMPELRTVDPAAVSGVGACSPVLAMGRSVGLATSLSENATRKCRRNGHQPTRHPAGFGRGRGPKDPAMASPKKKGPENPAQVVEGGGTCETHPIRICLMRR